MSPVLAIRQARSPRLGARTLTLILKEYMRKKTDKRHRGMGWLIPAASVGLVIGLAGAPANAQHHNVDSTWLTFDTAARTVHFQLIAGLTGLNGALNFNGFRDGELTLVVPAGWKTEISFRNHDGMLPHSAEVIAPQQPLPTQPVSPAISRAFTLNLEKGLPPEGTDNMRFTATPAGEYLIFCGVPGHGAAGMWIRLQVSATALTPALLLTPAAARPW
jgi:sulfocyanin